MSAGSAPDSPSQATAAAESPELAAADGAVKSAEAQANQSALVQSLINRGYLRQMRAQDFSGALADFMRVVKIGTPEDQAFAAFLASGIALLQDHPRDGVALVTRTLHFYQGGNDPQAAPMIARCQSRLGQCYAAMHRYRQARSAYHRALARYNALQDLSSQVQTLVQLGSLAREHGDLEEAVSLYRQALERARAQNDIGNAAVCCDALASISATLGLAADAQTYYAEGADYRERLGDRAGRLRALIARSVLAAHGGDAAAATALQQLESGLREAQALGDQWLLATALTALAEVAALAGRKDEAVSHAQSAQSLYEALGMPGSAANNAVSLAQIHEQFGEPEAAEAAYREALAICRGAHLTDVARTAHLGLAATLFGRDRFTEARAEIAAAWHASRGRSPVEEFTMHAALGLIAGKLGDELTGLRELEAAVRSLDTLRLLFALPDGPVALAGTRAGIYELTVQALLRAGQTPQALAYAEQARSRSLLRLLALTTLPDPRGAPTPLVRREASQLKRARQALARLRRQPDDAAALAELRRVQRRLEKTWDEIGGQYAELRRGDAAGWDTIRSCCQVPAGRRVVLVEYFVTAESILVFGVRADLEAPEAHEIPIARDTLHDFVLGHFAAVGGGQGRVLRTTNQQVRSLTEADFQSLCGPLVAPLLAPCAHGGPLAAEGDIVWFVPHDVLHYLPLHALALEGRPVIERNPVCYTPGASVMTYCRENRRSVTGRSLILADSRPDRPIPYARAQAGALGRLLTPGAEVGTGEHASKDRLVSWLAERDDGVGVVHLGCHGTFDPDEPLQSFIQLAPPAGCLPLDPAPASRSGGAGPWDLTAHEVFGLPIPAGLVALAACESGVNDRRPGDELFGLTRALFYAGTPSALVSLWSVDELSTSMLMDGFYRELQAGAEKALALQRAQIDVQRASIADGIAYCRKVLATGDASSRRLVERDIANLQFRARDFSAAGESYARLLAAVQPDSMEAAALAAAHERCVAAGQAAVGQPDYSLRCYAHPYYWAGFILVGDWR